jgi:hypothetical protein
MTVDSNKINKMINIIINNNGPVVGMDSQNCCPKIHLLGTLCVCFLEKKPSEPVNSVCEADAAKP